MMFLTRRMLQICLVVVWSGSWTLSGPSSLSSLPALHLTWPTCSSVSRGRSLTDYQALGKIKKYHSVNVPYKNIQALSSQRSSDIRGDFSFWCLRFLRPRTGGVSDDGIRPVLDPRVDRGGVLRLQSLLVGSWWSESFRVCLPPGEGRRDHYWQLEGFF